MREERTLSPLNLTVDLLETRSGDDAPGRVDVNLLNRMAEELLELLSPIPKKPSSSVSKPLFPSFSLSLKPPSPKPAISRPTSEPERGETYPRNPILIHQRRPSPHLGNVGLGMQRVPVDVGDSETLGESCSDGRFTTTHTREELRQLAVLVLT